MSVRRSWEVWAYLDEVDDARHPVVPLFVAHVRRAAQVAAVGPDTTCNTICPSGCTGCSRHESRVQRKRNELPVNDFELWLSFDRKMARRITRLIGRFSVIRSAGSENQSPQGRTVGRGGSMTNIDSRVPSRRSRVKIIMARYRY